MRFATPISSRFVTALVGALTMFGSLGCDDSGPDCGHDLMASPLDRERHCWLEPRTVGCIERDRVCTGVITYGVDSTGACHRFPSGCMPDGFSRVELEIDECSISTSALPDAGRTTKSIPECMAGPGDELDASRER